MDIIKSGDWVECSIAGLNAYGFAEHAGGGYFWIKSPDGVENDLEGLKIHFTHMSLVPLELNVEDIKDLIDLALEMRDKEWFGELVERLHIAKEV